MNVRLRGLARASDARAEAWANEELGRGGSAVGAVLCGYFGLAGVYPGVLLGPVSLLLGGIGSGERAFDGRVRQPGRGTTRPRGVGEGVEPPIAARIGVPTSVPALLVALGYGGTMSLGRLVRGGVEAARELGSPERAAVLARVGEVGALALAEPELSLPLVRAFGPPSGGLLTLSDFARPEALDAVAERSEDGERRLLTAPWAREAQEPFVHGAVICAIDINGLVAAACFECQAPGVAIEELGLAAPLSAQPTRRGVRRVSPGTPLPAPAPLLLCSDEPGALVEVWASPSALMPVNVLSAPDRIGIRRLPGTRTVEAII